MGDIAASGGVWVTTLSDEIWAKKETLTGSIGVYGFIPTVEGIYEWAGVQVDGVSSTKANEWDPRIAMPENVTKSIQAGVDDIYEKFVTKVSQNRKMPYEEVHAIAKGRIWSGEKALQLGLVDKIGGLDDAINSASVMADIEDYKVVKYYEKMDPFDIFISEFLKNINIESSLSKNSKKLISFFSKEYKFIDEEKDINNISYCFDCEFFFFK